MTLINETLLSELTQLYSATGRVYHGVGHVYSLLNLLREHRDAFTDIEVVEAAIWFHDSIYDTHAADNELKSAELAVSRLSGTVSVERLSRIRALIEATATHTLPPFSDARHVADAAMFLDMDLSILGADVEAFEAYESAIRQEYGWVTEADWTIGRTRILTEFADRAHIFYSERFRGLYEKQARENIRRSLARLSKIRNEASEASVVLSSLRASS